MKVFHWKEALGFASGHHKGFLHGSILNKKNEKTKLSLAWKYIKYKELERCPLLCFGPSKGFFARTYIEYKDLKKSSYPLEIFPRFCFGPSKGFFAWKYIQYKELKKLSLPLER